MKIVIILSAVFLSFGAMHSQAAGNPASADTIDPGLTLANKDSRGEIYLHPGVDWSAYTQIKLDPVAVTFRKNWRRDQNRTRAFNVRTEDMRRIEKSLAELFTEVFGSVLTRDGGFKLTDQPGEKALLIKPAIVNLDVFAPDSRRSAGRVTQYTDSTGRMTLELEIYDAATGDLIGTVRDRQESPRRGYFRWTNSVTNTFEARQVLRRWAGELRKNLQNAWGVSAA